MAADNLSGRLAKYGADLDGISSRFMDDMEFYKMCLTTFLDDATCEALGEALRENDRKRAFEAAHTLKGVVGNLGLIPLFDSVCKLVEPLRGNSDADLSAEYDELLVQLERVRTLLL